MHGRTTVMIAHRLSTVKIAHRIAVLDHGRLIELGTHDQLMAQNGLYARLYAMQFRDQDAAQWETAEARDDAAEGSDHLPEPARLPGVLGLLGDLGRSAPS
jgi:ABC-type methionine transport system ATPase subunit